MLISHTEYNCDGLSSIKFNNYYYIYYILDFLTETDVSMTNTVVSIWSTVGQALSADQN